MWIPKPKVLAWFSNKMASAGEKRKLTKLGQVIIGKQCLQCLREQTHQVEKEAQQRVPMYFWKIKKEKYIDNNSLQPSPSQ